MVEFLVFIFDLNFEIRGLDVDGFGGFTDYTSDAVEDLGCCLELTFLQGLIEEFGAHVLQTGQHIFAVTLPVFITPVVDGLPVTPSGGDTDAFTFSVLIDECASGETVELSDVEAAATLFDHIVRVARTTKGTFRRFLLLFRHDVYATCYLR